MPRIFTSGTSNLVRMANMGHRYRTLYRPLSTLRRQDYIRTYLPCSSMYFGSAVRIVQSYSRQLINLPRYSNTRPSSDCRRTIMLPAMLQFREALMVMRYNRPFTQSNTANLNKLNILNYFKF